jgi:hypothetical protein
LKILDHLLIQNCEFSEKSSLIDPALHCIEVRHSTYPGIWE